MSNSKNSAGKMRLAGGPFNEFLLHQIQIRAGNVIVIGFEPQRPFKPRLGGGVVSDLHVMPADDGDGVVAVRVKRLGLAEILSGLVVTVQPVEAHAVAQITVGVVTVEIPGRAHTISSPFPPGPRNCLRR